MADLTVNVDNFVRAETDRMFAALQHRGGGVNAVLHHREPAGLDDQTVVRQNRDTLYSMAVVDICDGATLTLPDAAGRYLSVMVVNEDHYINRVFHDAGVYERRSASSTPTTCWWRYASWSIRTIPTTSQRSTPCRTRSLLVAASARPFVSPQYDTASLDTTRDALLTLGHGLTGFERAFGRREAVDPVRHLVGTAGRLGRAAGVRGVLRQRRATTARRQLPAGGRRGARRRVLVDLRATTRPASSSSTAPAR